MFYLHVLLFDIRSQALLIDKYINFQIFIRINEQFFCCQLYLVYKLFPNCKQQLNIPKFCQLQQIGNLYILQINVSDLGYRRDKMLCYWAYNINTTPNCLIPDQYSSQLRLLRLLVDWLSWCSRQSYKLLVLINHTDSVRACILFYWRFSGSSLKILSC